MVERFFRDITTQRLSRGVITSVPDLVAVIDEYVAYHNTNPKPFIWTQSARDILQKVIRANCRLSSKQCNTALAVLNGSQMKAPSFTGGLLLIQIYCHPPTTKLYKAVAGYQTVLNLNR